MALLLLSSLALATGATGTALAQSAPATHTVSVDPHTAFVQRTDGLALTLELIVTMTKK